MALVEQATCKIERINDSGLGEGATDKGPVILPYVLPGDFVEFERHVYRSKSNTILKNIIEFNTTRADSKCSYFGACGGCLLQHFAEENYKNFKIGILENALKEYGIFDISVTKILPIIFVPFGNRRRANFEAVKKNNQVYLGFHRFHSHQIINLNNCPALLPELSCLLEPLKEALENVMEDREKLVMFITKAASGIDISIEIHNCKSIEENKRESLRKFAEKHNIARLIFRYRKKIDVIHGNEVPYVLFDNVAVEIDSHCFLQSSDASDRVLSDMVVKYLVLEGAALDGKEKILDLFCGRGTYTIPLSKYAFVDGFECDSKALKALGEAGQKNNLPISLAQRDLFTYPLTSDELKSYKKCIINPPRAGAEEQIKNISQSNIEEICYVSCSPQTFARDAKILINSDYRLTEVTPFDQFYYSPHLEVIGFFRKNNNFR